MYALLPGTAFERRGKPSPLSSAKRSVATRVSAPRKTLATVQCETECCDTCVGVRSYGERYLSTVLFNNLWSEDSKAEDKMPSTWREQSGEEKSTSNIPKL